MTFTPILGQSKCRHPRDKRMLIDDGVGCGACGHILEAGSTAVPEPDDRAARKCRHPRHLRLREDPLSGLPLADGTSLCGSCFAVIDGRAARRGKNNRSRGNAIEREIGKSLGLTRVGQYGTPTDLGAIAEPFAVQVKSGGAFPERFWAWLKAIPATAGQTPLLVVTDAPGAGRKRRAVVVLDLAEWVALHGPSGVA